MLMLRKGAFHTIFRSKILKAISDILKVVTSRT